MESALESAVVNQAAPEPTLPGVAVDEKCSKLVQLTVDILVIDYLTRKVLLIQRGREPFKGKWAMPGGRVDPTDENLVSAAARELYEETGIDVRHRPDTFALKNVIGNKYRDPRGFTATVIYRLCIDPEHYTIKADDDAAQVDWFEWDKLPDMAFDHREIIESFHVIIYN